jgi:hypothetical protein
MNQLALSDGGGVSATYTVVYTNPEVDNGGSPTIDGDVVVVDNADMTDTDKKTKKKKVHSSRKGKCVSTMGCQSDDECMSDKFCYTVTTFYLRLRSCCVTKYVEGTFCMPFRGGSQCASNECQPKDVVALDMIVNKYWGRCAAQKIQSIT